MRLLRLRPKRGIAIKKWRRKNTKREEAIIERLERAVEALLNGSRRSRQAVSKPEPPPNQNIFILNHPTAIKQRT